MGLLGACRNICQVREGYVQFGSFFIVVVHFLLFIFYCCCSFFYCYCSFFIVFVDFLLFIFYCYCSFVRKWIIHFIKNLVDLCRQVIWRIYIISSYSLLLKGEAQQTVAVAVEEEEEGARAGNSGGQERTGAGNTGGQVCLPLCGCVRMSNCIFSLSFQTLPILKNSCLIIMLITTITIIN